MHLALKNGDYNELKVEADIDNPEEFDRATTLRFAIREGHLKIVTYQIKKGADIELRDKHGQSVIFYLVSEQSVRVQISLLKGLEIKSESDTRYENG